jgi:hypothetical protein
MTKLFLDVAVSCYPPKRSRQDGWAPANGSAVAA